MPYIQNYCQFTKSSDGSKYKAVTQKEIRNLMKKRVAIDRTLDERIHPKQTKRLDPSIENLPVFQHFCWNLSIIRHSLQPVASYDELIMLYRKNIVSLFGNKDSDDIFTFAPLNEEKHENVMLLTIETKAA